MSSTVHTQGRGWFSMQKRNVGCNTLTDVGYSSITRAQINIPQPGPQHRLTEKSVTRFQLGKSSPENPSQGPTNCGWCSWVSKTRPGFSRGWLGCLRLGRTSGLANVQVAVKMGLHLGPDPALSTLNNLRAHVLRLLRSPLQSLLFIGLYVVS